MSRKRRRRPTHHDYRIGELVTLETPITPLGVGEIVQVVGFKGAQLRLLPIGGLPVLAHFELVERTGLPCGSEKPPHRRFQRRRKPSRGEARNGAAAPRSAGSPHDAARGGLNHRTTGAHA